MKNIKLAAANCLLIGIDWIKPGVCTTVLICLIFGTLEWAVTGNLDTVLTRLGLAGLWTAIPICKGCEYVEDRLINKMDLEYNRRLGGYVYHKG